MKAAFVGFVAVVLVAAGCAGSRRTAQTVTVKSPPETVASTTTVTVTETVAAQTDPVSTQPVGLGAPADVEQFGYIRSLRRTGASFALRFDPAWLLSGATASAAAAVDGVGAPGEPVANDYYVVDEGHRLLSYTVPADARVDVLVGGVVEKPISVADLARIVAGGDPLHGGLFEPIETGFWLDVHVDTVRALRQRYVP